MNLGVNPGPLNEDVLFLSDTHRARALFTNTIPDNVQLNVVSGIDYVCPIEQNVAKCAELLGFTPQQNDITGGRIKLARILSKIKSDFPENPTELETVQRARLYILHLFGATPFPDSANHMKFMQGNILFGQGDIWSDVLVTNVGMGKNYIWWSNLSYSQTIAHVVKGFRSQLTELHESMWEIVEYHAPSKVIRQFNILQKIPNALPIDKAEHKRLHALTRQGKANKDWRREHHHYMQAWDGQFFNVVNGEFNNVAGVSIDYMQWFWERTVLHITNPGHHEANPHVYQNHGERFQVMVDGVTQMYQMTGNLIGTYPENAQQLEPLRDMAIDFMGIVNQRSRLNYSTTHLTRNNVEFGDDTVPQRARRRTRTRARTQGDESNATAENFEVGEPSNPNQDYLPVFKNETGYRVHPPESPFFKGEGKLDGDFWGTLLGYRCNGRLWPMVEKSKFAAIYANGTHELYPPFWEVDYVYIPLCTRVVDDWYLVRINLQTMELVQYWPNKGYAKDYRRLIHFPTMDVLPLKFDWLLDEIQYWRNC
ncbi:hypothetical protein E3N88_25487 [Mikania micrantha]|uniref:Aminotransferase-like plant mobile domain-containing protein n=1 Tax=Mikania micrantha TaxID=192012 RepID=A0A5N6N4V5_9ASTR|nr:hypothetical protein E3N88_25487 [Mikania micrantha]